MHHTFFALTVGLGISISPLSASPPEINEPDVTIVPLTECLYVPKKVNPIAVKQNLTNDGTELCDIGRHPCWEVNHVYKRETKDLVVKKKYCHNDECFKEVKRDRFVALHFYGPANERSKDRALSHIQQALDQFLAENEIKLCP